MKLSNHYLKATDVDGSLFAVQLSDNGWSIADGPGEPDEDGLAGWHLPVRFETEAAAVAAIHSGPHAWFDLQLDGKWAQHALANGGRACSEYGA